MEKQFLLFFVCEEPWNYLRNYKLPSELIIRSGLSGLKRKAEDIETLVLGDKFSWLSVEEEKFIVAPPLFNKIGNKIPVPFLKGKIGKNTIVINRDIINFHPLYFARLYDGFIFSSRKEWISKLKFHPQELEYSENIRVSIETIELLKTKHKIEENDNVEFFIQNVEEAYKELKRLGIELFLVPSGSIGDLILVSLFEDITVVIPRNINTVMLKRVETYECELKFNKNEIIKLLDKIEAHRPDEDAGALLFSHILLSCGICRENKLAITGLIDLNTSINKIRKMIQNMLKGSWPHIFVPITLSGDNIFRLHEKETLVKLIKELNIRPDTINTYRKRYTEMLSKLDKLFK